MQFITNLIEESILGNYLTGISYRYTLMEGNVIFRRIPTRILSIYLNNWTASVQSSQAEGDKGRKIQSSSRYLIDSVCVIFTT